MAGQFAFAQNGFKSLSPETAKFLEEQHGASPFSDNFWGNPLNCDKGMFNQNQLNYANTVNFLDSMNRVLNDSLQLLKKEQRPTPYGLVSKGIGGSPVPAKVEHDSFLLEFLRESMALNKMLAEKIIQPQVTAAPNVSLSTSPNITIGGDTIDVDVKVGGEGKNGSTKWDYKRWKKEQKGKRNRSLQAGLVLPFRSGIVGQFGWRNEANYTGGNGFSFLAGGAHTNFGNATGLRSSDILLGFQADATTTLFNIGKAPIYFGGEGSVLSGINFAEVLTEANFDSRESTTVTNPDGTVTEIDRVWDDDVPYPQTVVRAVNPEGLFMAKLGTGFEKAGLLFIGGIRVTDIINDERQLSPVFGAEIIINKNFRIQGLMNGNFQSSDENLWSFGAVAVF